ncbi:hypothetical protein [Nocardioides sp. cx-173]|uniref:hypothetical protein n=1 Tax=Nocardioides sp. cx-173 TaxID=2898796 RepID=UPI001E3C1F45|nr:hypothetical protein [Nocardioides sp. cx-173]MCD4526917.1 hypothetical protein [Nocardioides sp. cx-173]UGB41295.1 hypothetical protein LQ940_18230 [Nocardioides sp. cx-173]
MRPADRAVVVLLALVISALALLLVAGHGPWAGRQIFAFDVYHGINTGDVPVLLMWAASMCGCGYLLFRRD